jgi:hypothetical protein
MPDFFICTLNLGKIYRKGPCHSGWPYIEIDTARGNDLLDMLSGYYVFARSVFSHRKKREEFIPCCGSRPHRGSELHHYEILRLGEPTDWIYIQDILGNNDVINTMSDKETQRAQLRKLLEKELIKARIRRPPLPLLIKDVQVLAVCGLLNRLDLLNPTEVDLWHQIGLAVATERPSTKLKRATDTTPTAKVGGIDRSSFARIFAPLFAAALCAGDADAMQRFQAVRRWASLEPWCTLGIECARSVMREGKGLAHLMQFIDGKSEVSAGHCDCPRLTCVTFDRQDLRPPAAVSAFLPERAISALNPDAHAAMVQPQRGGRAVTPAEECESDAIVHAIEEGRSGPPPGGCAQHSVPALPPPSASVEGGFASRGADGRTARPC